MKYLVMVQGTQVRPRRPGSGRTSSEATDRAEILGLYDILVGLVPGPVERLNRAVAAATVHGPRAASGSPARSRR